MRMNFQKTKNPNLYTFLNTVLIKHEVFVKHSPLPIILQMASLQLHINTDLKLCSQCIHQVNKPCTSIQDHRIKMGTSQQKNRLGRKQQSQPNLVFLLMSAPPSILRPPQLHFLSVRGCASSSMHLG